MATEGRRTETSLAQLLFNEPYRFEFFQVVRLLERLAPQRQPIGRDGDPSQEAVRFRTHASLSFPASQVQRLTVGKDEDGREQQARLFITFMGLIGTLGVLPVHYTEIIMERFRNKDTALWEFVDLFNHRMVSLFYRAWEKYRFPVAYERGESDRFTEFLFDIVGFGTRGLRNRNSFRDEALLRYAGLIGQPPHCVAAIEAILSDYFGVTIRVCQFVGQWLKLEKESITRLGAANSELGVNTISGTRVWDNQAKIRLRIGPLSYLEFVDLLPNGSAFKPLNEFLRLLTGMEFDFDIQLVLKADEVPYCVGTTHARRRPMLGWTTWLKTAPHAKDDDQVILASQG